MVQSQFKLTRRHLFGTVIAPAVGALLVSACGGSSPSAPTSSSASTSSGAAPQAANPPAAAGPVELVESSWATDTYGMFREQERLDLFAKAYPDSHITVKLRNVGQNYRDQILTQLAGGVGPDVFRLGWQDVFPFKEQGQISPLDDKFKSLKDSWLGSSDTKKDIIDGARYSGKLYAIPMGGDMSNIQVNKSLFQKAGLKDPPTTYDANLWSFDDIAEIGTKLTKRNADGSPIQFGAYASSTAGGSGNPFSLVESWGGKTLSDDWAKLLWAEDPGPAAWQWQADLVWKRKIAASSAEGQGGAFGFNNGRLAIYPSFVSQLSYHTQDVKDKFDWDQAPWPKQGNNPVKVMFWYSAWVMNAKGKHPDESFQLLQFIGGPKGTVPGVELGWELPLFKSLDASYNSRISKLNKNIKPALDGFDHRIQRHYYHQPRWSEAWTKHISPALDDIFANKKTAAQALKDITQPVNLLLQEGAKLMGTG